MKTHHTFPQSFCFGVATSSFQIEGYTHVDGRGESIWDRFCATEGKVKNGDDGTRACEHFVRYPEDIRLMKQLGLDAYRFSAAWPRIFATGHEAVPNPKGLDFYDRLVDALLEVGIVPWVTLYHWDLPQTLEDEGGWTERSIVDHFCRFADAMSQRLGDRVAHWITHNEPWVASHLGYCTGVHAPGRKSWPESLAAAHHILLSHGAAVPIIRGNLSVPNPKVGITVNLCPSEPASTSAADRDAERWFDGFFNRWYLDPLFKASYPADMLRDYVEQGHLSSENPEWLQDGDLETIAVDCDFLGINYYSRAVIRSDKIPEEENEPRTIFDDGERTAFDWEVHAPSLRRLLNRLHQDYNPRSLYITENGCSYPDGPNEEGRVTDVARTRYFRQHLTACARSIEDGVPLHGYFAWSLLDNFEWAEGYSQRFGLTWVDFETQQRILKDSGHYYAEVLKNRRVTPEQGDPS
ncbi:MAG: GH1 family beta-glucosidase [Myxococcota bacterium]|nr:GH1 family beta-glucosidase [Myxococcota bacterium]